MWVADGSRRMVADTGRYEAFPDATVLPSGRIVVAWCSYESHYGPGHGKAAYSDDGGRSWSTPQQLVSGVTHMGAVGVASLGNRVAVLHMSLDTPSRSGWIQLSSNGGQTFGAPVEITGWQNTGWVFVSDLLWVDDATADGLMLVTAYGPDGVTLMASTDAGASWTRRATVIKRSVWQDTTETNMLLLPDGDILMLLRNDTTVNIEMLRSTDMGVTWSTPTVVFRQVSGLPRMTLMPDGTILATLRDRSSSANWWAMGSTTDEGQTWRYTQIDPGRMMYGRFLAMPDGTGRLVGATDDRNAYGASRIWIQNFRYSMIGVDARATGTTVDLYIDDLPSDAVTVTVTRAWNGRTHRLPSLWRPGSTDVRLVDEAAPVSETGGSATYTVRAVAADGTVTTVSVDVPAASIDHSTAWLSDPLDPKGAVLVDVMSTGDDSLAWSGDGGGLIAPMGGIAISTGRRRARSRAWRVKTHDRAGREAVIRMIERGSVLLLRGDPDCLDHPDGIVHMDVTGPSMSAVLPHLPERWFDLAGVEVAAPSQAALVPRRTYRDDLEEHPTYRASLTALPTYLARTRGAV